jgi:putative SOS response-associated peptidase YedK
MCGRYLTPDQAALEREWATLPRDIEYFQSWNFAPSMSGPVVIAASREPSPERQIAMMTWGLQP